MTKLRDGLALLIAVALGAGAIFFGLNWSESSSPDADALTPGALYTASFPDLHGQPQTLGQWQGKVVVLNLWATWCAPCRQEIPVLINMQRKYAERGVVVVGLAMDETAPVAKYSREMNIDYPILVGGTNASPFARRLGNSNGLLPFTVLIDRTGKIVTSHLGELNEARLENLLAPLI